MSTDLTGDVTTGADMARTPEVTGTPEPGTSTTPATATGPGGPGRLPAGELRRRVAGFLVDHAGGQFTAGEVARGLGRSSGAVGNALTVLAGRGEAEQTCPKPVRYTATPASAAAAAVIRTAVARTGGPAPATTGVAGAVSGSAGRAGASAAAGPGGGTEADAEVVSGPVARPKGQMYHPRRLSGLPDVTALRRLRAAGVPALLYGPPGTGKTSVVEAAFGDLVTVPGDGDTTVADLVGSTPRPRTGGMCSCTGRWSPRCARAAVCSSMTPA
jgi:nitric oxide reductase NorQ protein